jgi:hypothetical protein
MRNALIVFGSAIALGACSSDMAPPSPVPGAPTETRTQTAEHRLGGALSAPLHDVNLVRTKIPDVLLDAIDAPYARPRPVTCVEIDAEIEPLDQALGADLDRPPSKTNPGLIQRGGTFAGDTAVDAVRATAEGLIPYRSWVRKLTGAEAQDRLVRAAIEAGAVRRAYLKGMGLDRRCPPPASPTDASQNAVAGAQRLQRAVDAAAASR